ncbi:hypothetical protein PRZ48_015014 [Zasmidium cellare]|uniref:Uncharacterized protein n=1 Tax=Zasmidium cellare TaxID=395010 RepID=A0ABR0DXL0_ZASCE|nr:hypothetical protein PRZ48_015014 [Zasmidium cellare]
MAAQTQTLTGASKPSDTLHDVDVIRVGESRPYPDPHFSFTHVNYFKDADAAPPDQLNSTLSEHELRIARRGDDSPNVARTRVQIRNIQGATSEYSIAEHGFKVGHLDSKMKNWRDDDELKEVFFSEVDALLKKETGARWTFQYEHHVRTATLEEALTKDSKGAVDINGPVRRVHIDESPKSGLNEYNHYIRPNDPGNEHLRGRHVAIFNIWKPIKTVQRDPLCLCDARSIQDEDLQSGKVQVPNVGEIENFSIRPPKVTGAHEFVYVREQRPNQALIFRIMDTRIDQGAAKRSCGVAHTSFVDPGTETAPPRESVEVRSFCVF